MKSLFLTNWAPKLMSLVLASVLWFLIKKNVETTVSRLERAPSKQLPNEMRRETKSVKHREKGG